MQVKCIINDFLRNLGKDLSVLIGGFALTFVPLLWLSDKDWGWLQRPLKVWLFVYTLSTLTLGILKSQSWSAYAAFYHYLPAFIIALLINSATILPVLGGFVWGLGVYGGIAALALAVLLPSIKLTPWLAGLSERLILVLALMVAHFAMLYAGAIYAHMSTDYAFGFLPIPFFCAVLYGVALRFFRGLEKGFLHLLLTAILVSGLFLGLVFSGIYEVPV